MGLLSILTNHTLRIRTTTRSISISNRCRRLRLRLRLHHQVTLVLCLKQHHCRSHSTSRLPLLSHLYRLHNMARTHNTGSHNTQKVTLPLQQAVNRFSINNSLCKRLFPCKSRFHNHRHYNSFCHRHSRPHRFSRIRYNSRYPRSTRLSSSRYYRKHPRHCSRNMNNDNRHRSPCQFMRRPFLNRWATLHTP